MPPSLWAHVLTSIKLSVHLLLYDLSGTALLRTNTLSLLLLFTISSYDFRDLKDANKNRLLHSGSLDWVRKLNQASRQIPNVARY